MSELANRLAREAVAKIILDADVDGRAYAPCFRDCLSDNSETAELRIAEAIDAALNEKSPTAS